MKNNKLKEILRKDFNELIRPIFIKCKCEKCGENKNLELHHTKRFIDLFNDTIEELKLYNSDYTEYDVKLIRYTMLSKQQNIKYITLCKKCHEIITLEHDTFTKIIKRGKK